VRTMEKGDALSVHCPNQETHHSFNSRPNARLGFDLKILDSGFALPLARQHKRNNRRAPAELPSTGTSPAERGIACLNNLNESGRLCTTGVTSVTLSVCVW
jgi:hypothetical protein